MLNPSQYQMSQHQRLSQLRIKPLHLHKLLLETERLTYEQVRGHVSGGELLQLAIGHEQFAWLHRLSELIIQIMSCFMPMNLLHQRQLKRLTVTFGHCSAPMNRAMSLP
ncbi:hypothetical protein [Komarekiella delphini-convector]|uniref:hypothetical protein n=1 Tax=Komarekiella delphini-convector TaxID=3050158 RepID=UPI0032AFCF23